MSDYNSWCAMRAWNRLLVVVLLPPRFVGGMVARHDEMG